MPKSKRNKLVTLSQTRRKGREHKAGMIEGVRTALDEYGAAYVFEYETMRNAKLKELREDLKGTCRFFLGSNKVLQVALGRDEATELKEGIHRLSEKVSGQRGLLFTNLSHDEVQRKIEEGAQPDFARAGSLANETVELDEGPLEQFSHDMEPFLRKQGLPVRLNRGTIELLGNHTVCREGEPLSPEAATLLRLLGIRMAEFRLHLVARWAEGSYEEYELPEKLRRGKNADEGFLETEENQDEDLAGA